MIAVPYAPGMVFLCSDNTPLRKDATPMKHNYIVLGANEGQLGMIQAMSITSMANKDVKHEVPIKLCNESVSYIVPYNLHSISKDRIDLHNFKGSIVDTPRISKADFLTLLLDLYLDHLGLGTRDHVSVQADYDRYCEQFWKEFKDVPEFRDLKTAGGTHTAPSSQNVQVHVIPVVSAIEESDEASSDDISDEEAAEILGSIVRNTQQAIKPSDSIVDIKQPCDPSTSSYRKTGKKKGRKARRQAKRENRMIAKALQDAVKQEINDDIGITVTKPDTTTNSTDVFAVQFITPENVKSLQDTPRFIKDWSNDQLIMFMQAFEKYHGDSLYSMVTGRWPSKSALYQARATITKEIERRAITVPKDPLRRPMKDWSTKELQMFRSVMDAHERDVEFKLQYTGFKTPQQCYQLCYAVNKELKARTTV